MRFIALIGLLALSSLARANSSQSSEDETERRWQDFKARYSKAYQSDEEETTRFI
jgi:hypothetical protein